MATCPKCESQDVEHIQTTADQITYRCKIDSFEWNEPKSDRQIDT